MLSRTALAAFRSLRATPSIAPRPAARLAALPSSSAPLRTFSSSLPRRSDGLSDGEKLLKDKLEQELKGAKVQVQDVSGGCGSFYAISVEHESFKGLSTIKQHRLVNELLKDEIKGMHGLQLKTKAA
ncbi:hypothetical protein JCM10449v2_004187 [Rhodotorula kratochvilovae]